MNATSKYIPPTACLSPNYCKVLSPEETKSGEFSGSADSVISQCSFFFCFCVAVEIWHIRCRRYRRLLKAENRKKKKKTPKLKLKIKSFWVGNKQGFGGERRDESTQRLLLTFIVTLKISTLWFKHFLTQERELWRSVFASQYDCFKGWVFKIILPHF